MNRTELTQWIAETYHTAPDYPWEGSPESAVFRHAGNRKWFALAMRVPRCRIGLPGTEPIDILNLKCDPLMLGSFRAEPGIYPAYHMSKASWLTAALDGSAADETIKLLLDLSFSLTAPKPRRRGAEE